MVIADIDETGGKRVVDEIRKADGRAEFQRADIGEPRDIEQMISFTCERFGRIDILDNNAVTFTTGRIEDLSLEDWRKTLDVCLTGYWYATKCALGPMRAQGGGSIINISSVSGLGGDYTLGVYNSVKAAVINLTRTTAIEYARQGIRCNAICPGPILTPIFRTVTDALPRFRARLQEAVPMGRCGEPEEVAKVAVFLASEDASFVTGEYIVADGGLHAHTGIPSLGDG